MTVERTTVRPEKRMNSHSLDSVANGLPARSWLRRVRELTLWRPLVLPLFRRLWTGSALSLLADQAFFILLTLLVLQITGPGVELGALLAVAAVPGAALLPVGGWLADRRSPATIMAVASLGRTLLIGVLTVLVLLDGVALWHLYVLGGLLSALDAFFYPASMTVVPALVEGDRLEPANALVQGAEQVSGLAGPALAAGAVAAFGLGPAFATVALAFGLSAVAFINLARGMTARGATTGDRDRDEGGIAAVLAGARYAWADPVIRNLILILAALNVAAAGPLVVGGAALVSERFGGAGALGVLFSAFGAGSLLGVIAAGVIGRVRHRGVVLLAVTALFGVGLALVGLAPGLAAACVVGAGMGAAAGYLGVVITAWLQERVESALLGRVMSLVVLAAVALDPISFAATGALLEMGLTPLFALAGGLIVLTALLGASSRTMREFT